MTRAFDGHPVPREVLLGCIDLATRAPSAGKSQGWHFLVLDGDDVKNFWNITLPDEKRVNFAWPHLLDAPCIVLPCAISRMYVERYSEPDKAATGLGDSAEAWPVPYWTIDTSFATMTFLLAAEDAGLGALFFGIFNGETELRAQFSIPDDVQILGAVAVGNRRDNHEQPGRSARRPRRTAQAVASFGQWRRHENGHD